MRYLLIGLFIVLSLSVIVAAAKPEFVNATNTHSGKQVAIPEHAVEVSHGVFSLGTASYEGKLVEGYAFVDYKKKPAKPSGCNNDGKCQGWEDSSCGDCSGGSETPSSCYAFLGKGAKWKSVEPYVVNPANTEGLDATFIADNFALDIAKWEAAAGADIFGQGFTTSDALIADTVSPDGANEVYFGEITDEGAIAITIVWGVFKGAPSKRELVEWDQVYDQVDFEWSSSGELGKMDFENIATHELGHSIGLSDLYDDGCSEETMYGYATEGETKKSTLEPGDIAGAKELYK